MRCVNCGKNINDMCNFCPYCGHQVNASHKRNLIIIGNGFDMYLGLSSSYNDFFGLDNGGTYANVNNDINQFHNIDSKINDNGYVLFNGTHNSTTKVSLLLIFEYLDYQLISKILDKEDISDYKIFDDKGHRLNIHELKQLNKYSNDFKKKYSSLLHNCFTTNKDKNMNFWALYLILRKDDGDKQWSSIEDKIYGLLTNRNTDFYKLSSYLYRMTTGNIVHFDANKKDKSDKDISMVFKSLPNVKTKYWLKDLDAYIIIFVILRDYLIIESYIHKGNINSFPKYVKATLNYFGYLNKFFNGTINNINDVYNTIYKIIKQQLFEFEHDLNDYLLYNCVNKYKSHYGIDYYSVSNKLLNCISSGPYSLLNFNYTDPTKNNIDSLNHVKRNIHGVLVSDTNYSLRKAPVMGISDIHINMQSSAYKFTKNYRIMRLSCNNYKDIYEHKHNIVNIKFFGHSLSPADYPYFFNIFDQLNIVDNKGVKLIFYYAEYGNYDDDDCAVKQIESVNRLFLNYYKYKKQEGYKHFINPRRLIYSLSFEGRLVINNIKDKLKSNKKYPKLNRDIKAIHSIELLKRYTSEKDISNVINIPSLFSNIKFMIDKFSNKTLNSEYSQFVKKYKSVMGNLDNMSEKVATKQLDIIFQYAKETLSRLHECLISKYKK